MSLDSQEGTGLLQDLGLSASVTARTCTGSRSRTPGAGGLRSPGRSALPCATGPLARWKGNPKASLLLSARAPSSSDTKEQRQAPRPPRGLSAGRSSVSLASPASPPGRRKTPSQPRGTTNPRGPCALGRARAQREVRWGLEFQRPSLGARHRADSYLLAQRSVRPGRGGPVDVVAGKKAVGLRAARAPQDRRAASRPPFEPHCIRGKRLCGDVPLLPALPALPGCHRDIASPLHGDRLPRPTCPPTATQGPKAQRSERASDLCLPRPDNNKRPQGPAPAPEWPAPAAGIESSDSRWGSLPPVTPSVHFYWLRCLSVILSSREDPPPSLMPIGCGPRSSRPWCQPAFPGVAGGLTGGGRVGQPGGRRRAGRKELGTAFSSSPARPGGPDCRAAVPAR